MGYYDRFDSTKYIGSYNWYVDIPQCGHVEHELKDIAFMFKNT